MSSKEKKPYFLKRVFQALREPDGCSCGGQNEVWSAKKAYCNQCGKMN